MSFSYDRYNNRPNQRSSPRIFSGSSNRTALGYWVPLIVTVTAATVGVAAWIWSERTSADDDDLYGEYHEQQYAPPPPGPYPGPGETPPPGGAVQQPPPPPPEYVGDYEKDGYGGTSSVSHGVVRDDMPLSGDRMAEEQESYLAQWRRRTPSPQQFFDGASKRVAAGVAAVGRGLSSITEEEREGSRAEEVFSDHERWSEEAESLEREHVGRDAVAAGAGAAAGVGAAGALRGRQKERSGDVEPVVQQGKLPRAGRGRNRTVAIVVSALQKGESDDYNEKSAYSVQHASLLSHLIGHASSESTHLLILINAPHLSKHPLTSAAQPVSSIDSYEDIPPPSGIARQDSELDPEGYIISSYTDPANTSSSSDRNTLYTALATQAASLVSHPTHILPFTTPNGHVHLLRSLGPNLVYIQESLCGENGDGENVKAVEGWVGQTVVVLGEDAAGAGLVDTETEGETEDEGGSRKQGPDKERKWWMDERRVGLGKGVEVVEGMHLGEDFVRRAGS